jgi:hypothetical protein
MKIELVICIKCVRLHWSQNILQYCNENMYSHGGVKISSLINRSQRELWNLTPIMIATIFGYYWYYNEHFWGNLVSLLAVEVLLCLETGYIWFLHFNSTIVDPVSRYFIEETSACKHIRKQVMWHICYLFLGHVGFWLCVSTVRAFSGCDSVPFYRRSQTEVLLGT